MLTGFFFATTFMKRVEGLGNALGVGRAHELANVLHLSSLATVVVDTLRELDGL
jgi:hypothetical protein